MPGSWSQEEAQQTPDVSFQLIVHGVIWFTSHFLMVLFKLCLQTTPNSAGSERDFLGSTSILKQTKDLL